MKRKTILFVLSTLLSQVLLAQCLTLNSATFNADGTADLLIDCGTASSIWIPNPVNSWVNPDVNNQIMVALPLDYLLLSPAGLNFVSLVPALCVSNIGIDPAAIVNELAFVETAASGCSACDGAVTHDGFASFSVNGLQSSGNTLSGLCPGNYQAIFNPFVGTDASGLNVVTYYNHPLDFTIDEFGFTYTVIGEGPGAEINVVPIGGSGDYSIILLGNDGNLNQDGPDYYLDGYGCFTFTVTDNVSGCSISYTDYYTGAYALGDITGGGTEYSTPNGVVNAADLLVFLQAFGTFNGDGNYDAYADLNCDGAVNAADVLIFLVAFGGI